MQYRLRGRSAVGGLSRAERARAHLMLWGVVHLLRGMGFGTHPLFSVASTPLRECVGRIRWRSVVTEYTGASRVGGIRTWRGRSRCAINLVCWSKQFDPAAERRGVEGGFSAGVAACDGREFSDSRRRSCCRDRRGARVGSNVVRRRFERAWLERHRGRFTGFSSTGLSADGPLARKQTCRALACEANRIWQGAKARTRVRRKA